MAKKRSANRANRNAESNHSAGSPPDLGGPRRRKAVELLSRRPYGRTLEDIAAELALTQSTVSRHLFGTTRNGKKVGGAIPKLQKAIDKGTPAAIAEALGSLRNRMDSAA